MQVKLSKIYWSIVIISIPVTLMIYWFSSQTDMNAGIRLLDRDVETSIKLWINGYLGVLFSSYLGNINWLLIVLLPLYFYSQKQNNDNAIFSPLNKILFSFFLISFVLIALKGFFTPRYQYTLVPFFIFFVFYLNWLITSANIGMLRWRNFFAIFLFVIVLSSLFYRIFIKSSIDGMTRRELNEKLYKALNVVDIKNNLSKGIHQFDYKKPYHAFLVSRFIDNMRTDKYFIVDLLPDFYYMTKKKGYYYWNLYDIYYSEDGEKKLMIDTNNINELKVKLIKQMGCKYIYTRTVYFNYNKAFDKFIFNHCKLIAYDAYGRMLFEIVE